MMKALRDELKDKLLRNVSEFRVYLALEEAIHSVEGSGPGAERPQRSRSLRILARQLLSERAAPQSTGELAEGMRSLGSPTSDNSISSSLSQSPDFVSVRWGGRPRWWLANLPTPPEP
ncbi:hypothetical protein [Alsobacter soli]|uniref:hypothetical protein n=1 Tax=Alsobacter soli TaxID=2109933 RepID=UPI0011B263EF|nr:hypothetical protein [Alsobacter soli]